VDNRPPELERRGTAYHEAGHAVAALDANFRFPAVSMRLEDTGGGPWRHGGVLDINPADLPPPGRSGRIPAGRGWPVAIFLMAGEEAEREETGRASGWLADRTEIDNRVVTGGTGDAQASYKRQAARKARALLRARWAEVSTIAEALLEHERLEYGQVVRIAAAARGSE
jgi:hypothetical protein